MTPMPEINEEWDSRLVASSLKTPIGEVRRLYTVGRKGRSGSTVRLEGWKRASGEWVSSEAAIKLFRQRINDLEYMEPAVARCTPANTADLLTHSTSQSLRTSPLESHEPVAPIAVRQNA